MSAMNFPGDPQPVRDSADAGGLPSEFRRTAVKELALTFKLDAPLRVTGAVQGYPWGRKGSESPISAYVPASDSNAPYAEFWLGAHPDGKVAVAGSAVPLHELIAARPVEMLGPRVAAAFGGLPYLLKELSVGAPLSIQAHPDLTLAPVLHARDPRNYPDANHKPEVAIARGDLSFLYGFRGIAEIRRDVERLPALREMLGEAAVGPLFSGGTSETDALRGLYSRIMRMEKSEVADSTRKLVRALEGLPSRTLADSWVLRVAPSFPNGDVGVPCFYLMNINEIKAGTAVFIGPNIPHAYLDGRSLIECMANSNNVVRSGLTGKFQDTETLLSMVDYGAREFHEIKPVNLGVEGALRYRVPAKEFYVDVISPSLGPIELPSRNSATILFCLEGSCAIEPKDQPAITITRGEALFLPAAVDEYVLRMETGMVSRAGVPDSSL